MPITAYILLNIRTGKEYEIADKLKNIESIKEVTITYGLWDIVAKIEVGSMSELDKIVFTIRSIEGVEQTATLVGI
ncbi:MAG: Lrp/AsnC ligand binding domain-containing protein [Thermoproteales archaeon]|nr:Lrp/AsnC ligand binding domain-containing protein [Thermoproteales archaeon]